MRILFTVFAFLLTLSAPSFAGEDPVYTGWFNNNAVSGYDAVAYFTKGEPMKGKKEFSTSYKGAVWQFSSAENLSFFKANPGKYAPQYGGYCAWGMANGQGVSADPEAWSIVGGKLYLNYNQSVRERWLEDTEWAIAEADKAFPGVVDDYKGADE